MEIIFNGNSIFFGVFYSSFIMCIYLMLSYMAKRNKEVNDMYNSLEKLANNYFKMYPKTPGDYFNEIICDKQTILTHFWVKDLNEFIIDKDKLTLLVKANEKDVKKMKEELEEEMVIEFTPNFDSKLICPWCSALEFEWVHYENENGTMCCKGCGATTPVGTREECEQMLDENNN